MSPLPRYSGREGRFLLFPSPPVLRGRGARGGGVSLCKGRPPSPPTPLPPEYRGERGGSSDTLAGCMHKGTFRIGGTHRVPSKMGLSWLEVGWKVVELWTLPAEEFLA